MSEWARLAPSLEVVSSTITVNGKEVPVTFETTTDPITGTITMRTVGTAELSFYAPTMTDKKFKEGDKCKIVKHYAEEGEKAKFIGCVVTLRSWHANARWLVNDASRLPGTPAYFTWHPDELELVASPAPTKVGHFFRFTKQKGRVQRVQRVYGVYVGDDGAHFQEDEIEWLSETEEKEHREKLEKEAKAKCDKLRQQLDDAIKEWSQ